MPNATQHNQVTDIENLSKMALRAAKELDKLHRGQDSNQETVAAFLGEVGKIKLDDDDTQDSGYLKVICDPMTISSLQHAMGVRKLKDLENKIHNLSNAKVTPQNAYEIMESCLKIHRHLMPMRWNQITGKLCIT